MVTSFDNCISYSSSWENYFKTPICLVSSAKDNLSSCGSLV